MAISLLDNKYNQAELKKINLPKQYFQTTGPYLSNPEVTKRPRVIPNKYNDNNKNKEEFQA